MKDRHAAFKCKTCKQWLQPSNPQSQDDRCCLMCFEGHGGIVAGHSPKELARAMKEDADEKRQAQVAEWIKGFDAATEVPMGCQIAGTAGVFARVRKVRPLTMPAIPCENRLAVLNGEVWEFRVAKRQPKVQA